MMSNKIFLHIAFPFPRKCLEMKMSSVGEGV